MHAKPWTFFFILFLFSSSLIASAVNHQGEALLSWKQSLNLSAQELNSWNSNDETPCGWFGITCNFKQEVVEIEFRYVELLGKIPTNFSSLSTLSKLILVGTNLTDSIPKEIGDLRELNTLDLSVNSLTGEIPIEICGLRKLKKMDLSSNILVGSIPAGIGNLTILKELGLHDNQLSGQIPRSIGNLKLLELIRAGGNRDIEGNIPPEIGNCTNLVYVGFAETRISGSLPPSLGLLKKLKTLAFYTTLLSGKVPPEIGNCSELQYLFLYETSLTGSIPTSFGNLQNLLNLFLYRNRLTGTLPEELGNCYQLLDIDISMNSLTGSIPITFGNLTFLQELNLGMNNISGEVPANIGNWTELTHLMLDNNQITGLIPSELGNLKNLRMLFLWHNKLEGSIPSSISNCEILEEVDLSVNGLTGHIPGEIFHLKKLNSLMLLSNNLLGVIPPDIGNCSSLNRFRVNNNMLFGALPPQIGNLNNLSFLDLGENRLTGEIPDEISGCKNLTFIDIHSNSISGALPSGLDQLIYLQIIDFSNNLIEGNIDAGLGLLSSLTKLILYNNRFSGPIPNELGSCLKLQLLDLSANQLSGNLPWKLGDIPALEIALNLSWNQLNGEIPSEFAYLDRLGILDLSHNHLSGDLQTIAVMQNLVVLNVSDNNFSGRVPETSFFKKLPPSVLSGNPNLCYGSICTDEREGRNSRRESAPRVAVVVLLCIACTLLMAALYIAFGSKKMAERHFYGDHDGDGVDSDLEIGHELDWEMTLYQKLDLSISDVAKKLTAGNILGRGRSGVVYQVNIPPGVTIAVKRFKTSEKFAAAAFSSEISTLANIRHRNIIRLLGWAANRKTKLLFYDYWPHGNLGDLLHERCAGGYVIDWDARFKIAIGVADGLAYLHHDCVPAISHRDVKVQNILLSDEYDACLTDFGFARFIEDDLNDSSSANPLFVGSYGYIAPEYGRMLKVTEKSDVYSYGIVLLEMITGKKPADPSFAEGQHIIEWVRQHLYSKNNPIELLDPNLKVDPDAEIQEMLQVLEIALLCTNNRAYDRPTMKDIAALLRVIQTESRMKINGKKPGNGLKRLEIQSYLSSSLASTRLQLLQCDNSRCSFAHSSSSGYPHRSVT
ncbi:LRR receptor-like serine/threonine-protein kinase [Momordica charantia]|uniref:non-specific serine/threonine protein kinase n=1 Tax=Momordica charantia TaxID=3673 RepID=A0A6J1C6J9_MOMCH|nr:LRR receptor-like serine/threonine-protein kinase [Momordica charantia]